MALLPSECTVQVLCVDAFLQMGQGVSVTIPGGSDV